MVKAGSSASTRCAAAFASVARPKRTCAAESSAWATLKRGFDSIPLRAACCCREPARLEIALRKRNIGQEAQGVVRTQTKRELCPLDRPFRASHPGQGDGAAPKHEDIGIAERQGSVEKIERGGAIVLVERRDECGERGFHPSRTVSMPFEAFLESIRRQRNNGARSDI
jgi:hypothetical protein